MGLLVRCCRRRPVSDRSLCGPVLRTGLSAEFLLHGQCAHRSSAARLPRHEPCMDCRRHRTFTQAMLHESRVQVAYVYQQTLIRPFVLGPASENAARRGRKKQEAVLVVQGSRCIRSLSTARLFSACHLPSTPPTRGRISLLHAKLVGNHAHAPRVFVAWRVRVADASRDMDAPLRSTYGCRRR